MDGLREFDLNVFRTIHEGWSARWLDHLFWVISSSGLGYVQVLLIMFFLHWSAVWERTLDYAESWAGRVLNILRAIRWADFRQMAGPMLFAFAVSGLVHGTLKKLIPRDRPSNFVWSDPQEGFFYNSFPSGHTTTSFALAFLVLFWTWGTRRWWWGPVALAWAVLVAISRIYRGVHWPTDTLGGACVGLFSAALVWLVLRGRAQTAPSE